MAIKHIEVKDFMVFKGDFATNLCPGINLFIGGNGTGKTTLLKLLYVGYKGCFAGKELDELLEDYFATSYSLSVGHVKISPDESTYNREFNSPSSVFIPEKDILEHAKGLLTFIEQKQTGFGQIYKDVLIAAQDVPTQEQSEAQKCIGKKIATVIGGDVCWDKGDGSFYTMRTDGKRIPFTNEASGFKKLGFLGLLLACGQLSNGSVLFWDEPENSLNPELIPTLVDILLELSRNGVQIFLATHSEIFANYFSVNKQKHDHMMFYSLYRYREQIIADSNDQFDLLNPNKLTEEPVKLYEKRLDRGFSSNE